ncbi:phosphatidylglycerophosphatase A family protein [Halomonas sp. V046]|uniref:phosphatidylglycerophosphatase A family protein n=1 Tax=Halomonas sp. V046 TaxID=3459611 RepID=UPI004043ABF5
MQDLLMWLATGLGLGHSPWAPGTVGSLLGLPLAWWLLGRPVGQRWAISLALIVLAVPLCHLASGWLGGGDAAQIVADEWVAMPLAVLGLAAAPRLLTLAAGYLLFRLFDVTKVPPVMQVETIGGGLGIVGDDVIAALYAALVLAILLRPWQHLWSNDAP